MDERELQETLVAPREANAELRAEMNTMHATYLTELERTGRAFDQPVETTGPRISPESRTRETSNLG